MERDNPQRRDNRLGVIRRQRPVRPLMSTHRSGPKHCADVLIGAMGGTRVGFIWPCRGGVGGAMELMLGWGLKSASSHGEAVNGPRDQRAMLFFVTIQAGHRPPFFRPFSALLVPFLSLCRHPSYTPFLPCFAPFYRHEKMEITPRCPESQTLGFVRLWCGLWALANAKRY